MFEWLIFELSYENEKGNFAKCMSQLSQEHYLALINLSSVLVLH